MSSGSLAKILLRSFCLRSSLVWILLFMPVRAVAQELSQTAGFKEAIAKQLVAAEAEAEEEESDEQPNLEPFDQVIKNTQKSEGVFTLYHNKSKGKLYLEIKPEQLNKNFLCIMTLSTGIGQAGLFKGMPAGEMLFQFRRRQNNTVQFVVPNVNFRTRPGDPLQRSLDRSFSDSVLYSLKLKSIHPERKTLLIDLSDLILGKRDLPGLTSVLSSVLGASYSIDSDASYISEVEAFPLNAEIETVYGFSSTGDAAYIASLPDSRAFNLSVHYSFSELPVNNGYKPRLADERVGYFVTAYKDFGNDSRKEPFVRYINRWNLEKQDPNAPLSPPKEPIVFWIENTVPIEYRAAIENGILMWNEAFKQAGFINAIEARQMPDNADWSPADVRYNVIRWSASFQSGFLGLGPSRVNPLTGEILDADILIDADVVRFIKGEYRTFAGGNAQSEAMETLQSRHPCTQTLQQRYLRGVKLPQVPNPQGIVALPQDESLIDLCFSMESSRQFATGAIAMSLLHDIPPSSAQMDKFVNQYLSLLIAHEVGHTLGLRHNFHGSTLLAPEELNNTEITRTRGMVASVMDYVPVNLAPPGVEQGDYFPVIVGPYDKWAIEYGYKPIDAPLPIAELPELRKIAQRAAEPELAYAADEDTFADLDPAANWYDLSSNMLTYSQWQLENAQAMWSRLNKRYPVDGESYSEVRDMFNAVFFYYFQHAMNTTLYVGGQSFNRNFAGDPNGRLPFEPIPVEQQREALKVLQKYVFAENAFQFTPQLLNQLAPSRWWHWGTVPVVFPLDYPIGDRILLLQQIILRNLLDPTRLTRIRDMELKAEPGKEALKLPELFETLQTGIWTEVIDKNAKLEEISSIRRSLQRDYVEILIAMVLRTVDVPEDARTLAWYNLRQLREQINADLRKHNNLDTYTKAHLAQTRDRINKALEAPLQSN